MKKLVRSMMMANGSNNITFLCVTGLLLYIYP